MEQGGPSALPALWAERLVRDAADLAPDLPKGSYRACLDRAGMGVPLVRDRDLDLYLLAADPIMALSGWAAPRGRRQGKLPGQENGST